MFVLLWAFSFSIWKNNGDVGGGALPFVRGGGALEYRNVVYYSMGQFLKRVYAFRKYTRKPGSSILIPGSVFCNGSYAFRKYTRTPKPSILFYGPIVATCIYIPKVY